jgi:site-specific DNA-methyltransferase (cytosine-N4-specific)
MEAIKEPSTGQGGLAADFRRCTKESVIPNQSTTQHRDNRESTHDIGSRNKRTVWTINPEPTSYAHFATFPQKLVEPPIMAGSKAGDIVIDIFSGSGTVGVVAKRLQRKYILIDLNAEYNNIAIDRLRQTELAL